MNNKILYLTLVVLSFCGYSQNKTITGKVLCFNQFPVNKVKVKYKKSDKTILTDNTGKFSIPCVNNKTLIFEADGFFEERKKIKCENDNTDLKVNLVYNEKEKESYNNAINSEHLNKIILNECLKKYLDVNNNFENYTSIYEVIQYVYPLTKFIEINGIQQILLVSRGENSINAGVEALLVVDNIITSDISSITPIEVKSIKILQGNDAAKWGIRGSNGVVIIKLKNGRE